MGADRLTDAEIMSNVLEALDVSALKFCKKLGYSDSTIYHVLNGDNNISTKMADRAVEAFPQLNYMYLSRGEGPITLSNGEARGQANLFGITGPSFDSVPQTLLNIENLLGCILDELKGLDKK